MDKNIKLIDTNTLLFYHQQIKNLLNAKVNKVEGKSLISDLEIARLSSVVNYDDKAVKDAISEIEKTIQEIQSSGYDDTQLKADIAATYATIASLNTKANSEDLTAGLASTLSSAKSYTDTEINTIKSTLTGGMHYKGSVNSYADLPTDASLGDCYNIVTASEHNKANDNAIYTADGEWDITSGVIDLSDVLFISDLAANEDISEILNS